jgi:hypothetical protein
MHQFHCLARFCRLSRSGCLYFAEFDACPAYRKYEASSLPHSFGNMSPHLMHPILQNEGRSYAMTAVPDNTLNSKQSTPEIDRNAPAGSENSLGAQSIRDGRPSTDDTIIEAMDETTPGTAEPIATHSQSK